MDLQLSNELNYAEINKTRLLEAHKADLLEPVLAYVDTWLTQEFDYANRADLLEIVPAVENMDAEDTCWHILATVLLDGALTLQAVLGMFFHSIEVEMPYRKGRVLEVFIHAVMQSPHIEMKQVGKYLNLVRNKELNIECSQYGYVLPALYPEPVKHNKDAGYQTQPFHAITGGKLKQHDKELCLDHINRQNHIMFSINTRLWEITNPEFDATPKYKDKLGRYEDAAELQKRHKQFVQLFVELPRKIQLMIDQGNTFCFKNRYDSRGRTYIKAHHFDYIGDKYARALIHTSVAEMPSGAAQYF